MDKDWQIALKFLDEAEDCYDRIESTVLGLANAIADPQALDEALRAAHSVKGGSAMMGFVPLSQIAHQLEDFFKILRVHYHTKSIDPEVETLLLQGVDCLRQVGNLHRQDRSIDEDWLSTQSQPIFDRLRQHLGDLRPEDEDALLCQEGEVSPAILLFESGVKEALNHLEHQLDRLSPAQLLQALAATADELSEFGQMAKLDRFIALCSSVTSQCQHIDLAQATSLARQALKIWRKSHSVVLLGRFEQIPTQLPERSPKPIPAISSDLEVDRQVSLTAASFNPALVGIDGLIDMESIDLSLLQSEVANFRIDDEDELSSGFDRIPLPIELLDELAALDEPDSTAISNWGDFDPQQPEFADLLSLDRAPLELLSELAAVELPDLPSIEIDERQVTTVIAPPIATLPPAEVPPIATPQVKVAASRQTVRVPVEYLQQFNSVFGKLILERNAINLRLAEIQRYTGLLRKRIQHLEGSNHELRQWYDLAATEGLMPISTAAQLTTTSPTQAPSWSHFQSEFPTESGHPAEFDRLEMDRYSDLHLVSQNQIETIVQLQEVTADIELSLREMNHSVSSLNQTTRTLQRNITRTQMLPFADAVKRFPRLIRDLSSQYGKSVNLQIVGENTGIDRAMLDRLSDPLIHLLRNAFDHGIEDPATRLAAGKPDRGTIVLSASQRSGETIVTLSDDGGGIRLDRIRNRLQQMGLPIESVATMTEAQLLDTIFEPGFSTATSLTELSGRGVGMDVVRTNIEQVRGNIQVKTQLGVGTTFVIRVPFTLSIVRIMLLERAGFVFAVTVDSVREILDFQPDLLTADGHNLAWQSQVIPLIALEQGISFNRSQRSIELPGTPTIATPTILVVGEDRLSVAFRIDRYWGEQEVTSRSIDRLMPLTPGFGNSIILGDGRVVPLVDLMQLAGWMSSAGPNSPTNPIPTVITADRLVSAVSARTKSDTILVIDDSIAVRRYLAVMLGKEGYQVEQAKDGREAVEKLLGGLVVQAALCDVEMPRLDGYGVLEALRSTETFADLPIVMLTSRSSDKHQQLAMNLGASAYFVKPYTESELLATLSDLIVTARSLDWDGA
jgi:two-component system, chemotaxis family, sensor histidine kinase and response regulator PixL